MPCCLGYRLVIFATGFNYSALKTMDGIPQIFTPNVITKAPLSCWQELETTSSEDILKLLGIQVSG